MKKNRELEAKENLFGVIEMLIDINDEIADLKKNNQIATGNITKILNNLKLVSLKTVQQYYREQLDSLVTFNSDLLVPVIYEIIDEKYPGQYELFTDEYCDDIENINNRIAEYIFSYKKDPYAFYRPYCTTKENNYHMILPTKENLENLKYKNIEINEVPVICFPANEKIKVLNYDGTLNSDLSQFKNIYSSIINLINYRHCNTELSEEELIKSYQKRK